MSREQKAHYSPARNIAALSDRLGLPTVAAAWPIGISQLALAVQACQSCDADEVCTDWLARAPDKIATPPAFCPNAAALARAEAASAVSFARFLAAANAPGAVDDMARVNALGAVAGEDAGVVRAARDACARLRIENEEPPPGAASPT